MEPLLISLIIGFTISGYLQSRKPDKARQKSEAKQNCFQWNPLPEKGKGYEEEKDQSDHGLAVPPVNEAQFREPECYGKDRVEGECPCNIEVGMADQVPRKEPHVAEYKPKKSCQGKSQGGK